MPKINEHNLYDMVRSIQFPRAPFDLSHSHQGAYDMGYLYPVCFEEAVPGDSWNIGTQVVARALPLVAPIMHEINLYIHFFFVPYRILWPKPNYTDPTSLEEGSWEGFITGGPDGDNEDVQPIWDPDGTDKTVGSLWDNFGHPLTDCTGVEPTAFHKRAYNLIYNEFYRDQNLIDPVDLDSNTIKKRAWEKDYFTAALPWQQRGTAPALPVTGTSFADFSAATGNSDALWLYGNSLTPDANEQLKFDRTAGNSNITVRTTNTTAQTLQPLRSFLTADQADWLTDNNIVDLNNLTTFNVSDLRTAFQIQRWLERNARGGARYTEFLTAHYRVSPRDDRLQRPEYIGGTKQPLIISEVLQTSETAGTPQGEMAGHGITVGGDHAGNYRVQEHGIIMGIMSIMPRTMYTQGMNRTFLRETKYDYYFPEFANLSEQAILKGELYAGTDGTTNTSIFGFQGRYDELRQRNSRAVGLMRVTTGGLGFWNLARTFGSAPSLNQTFIEVESQTLKERCWAVTTEPCFVATIGNILRVNRPLPEVAEPGMIDHV